MSRSSKYSLFSPSQMARIDSDVEASGISIGALMERAGRAVAASALKNYPQALRYVAFCGVGNNGGDGFVAARALRESGANVVVYVYGDILKMHGAAKIAFENCGLEPRSLRDYSPCSGDVVIDALFGAGLSRNVSPEIASIIHLIEIAGVPVLAVDLPSGLCGQGGIPLGRAFRAQRTVTFMAKKPGHVLMQGRSLCGTLEVIYIGVPQRIMEANAGHVWENHPSVWIDAFPKRDKDTHKFKRGHLTVFSGPSHATGAARMAAMAGFRAGAGIVTIVAPEEAVPVLSTTLTAIMVSVIESDKALESWCDDKRHATFVLGPGFGDFEKARNFVSILKEKSLVLDADGITAFKDRPDQLFALFASPAPRILTPHEGEFIRLFPDIAADPRLGKIEKAQAAAAISNSVIVYKGADTVIAAPDGRAIVNTNAPEFLATAGSGDVLAGIAAGLLAQKVPAFEAAAAAVWIHGETASRLGPGLTAEDLTSAVRPLDVPQYL